MTADAKKRGLGRGLDALFQDQKKEEESFQPILKRADEMVAAANAAKAQQGKVITTAGGQRKLPVDKLTPGKFQPRRHFDEGAIDQLAESISVHGVLQPLLVRTISNSMFEIIAGERRWRAAQKAQLHEVPVVIQELTDKEALEIALIENLQREDLSAIEEAEGYQRLVDEFGHTQEMLAQQLGKSRSHVANTLRLLKLPAKLQGMIQKGLLSAGHARALIGAKNPEELANAIVKRGLSVRQAEKLVQDSAEGKLKPKKQKQFRQKDVDILALEERLTGKLGLRVTIESAQGNASAGRLAVDYKSLDQLEDLIARLSATPGK
ncbi:MAG: ParB/RepB/Spo0J family partition protein [Alphaproteobacteria bacterium]|nr:ParB/RepB/Spo0J family partition protein [Alphaproteobacteria bacterium]